MEICPLSDSRSLQESVSASHRHHAITLPSFGPAVRWILVSLRETVPPLGTTISGVAGVSCLSTESRTSSFELIFQE